MLLKLADWLFPPPPAPPIDDINVYVSQKLDGTILVSGLSPPLSRVRFTASKDPTSEFWTLVSRADDGARWFKENYPSATFDFNGAYHRMKMSPADEVMLIFKYDIRYMR